MNVITKQHGIYTIMTNGIISQRVCTLSIVFSMRNGIHTHKNYRFLNLGIKASKGIFSIGCSRKSLSKISKEELLDETFKIFLFLPYLPLYCNVKLITPNWSNSFVSLGKIYNLRTIVERKNSNEVVGYNRSKTPTRRIEWAKMFVSIGNITSLLTALTAFKVGRKDLIRAPTAFRRLHF